MLLPPPEGFGACRGDSLPTHSLWSCSLGTKGEQISAQECALGVCLGPDRRVLTSECRGQSQVSLLFLWGPHPQQARKQMPPEGVGGS